MQNDRFLLLYRLPNGIGSLYTGVTLGNKISFSTKVIGFAAIFFILQIKLTIFYSVHCAGLVKLGNFAPGLILVSIAEERG